MKKIFVVSSIRFRIKNRARDMDVLCSGEKELEVRAMDGLSRNVSRRKQKEDISKHDPIVMPVLESEVQDAREL